MIEEASKELDELWTFQQQDQRENTERGAKQVAWLASSDSPRTNYRVRGKVLKSVCALIERIAQNGGPEAKRALRAIENALANTETGPKRAVDNYGAIRLRVYVLRHLARCDPANAVQSWIRILKLIAGKDSFDAWTYALRHRRGKVEFEEREAKWAVEAAEELANTSREPICTIELTPIWQRLEIILPGVPRDQRLKLADRFKDALDRMERD